MYPRSFLFSALSGPGVSRASFRGSLALNSGACPLLALRIHDPGEFAVQRNQFGIKAGRYLFVIQADARLGLSQRLLVAEMLIGVGIGLLIGTGVWRLGLGVPADLALSCSAVLGTFSGLALGKNAGRRGPPPRRPASSRGQSPVESYACPSFNAGLPFLFFC